MNLTKRIVLTPIFVAGLLAAAPALAQVEPTPALSAREQYQAAEDRAVEQVLLASRSDDPFLRANAIEAMHPRPNRAMPLAQLGLKDPHPAVRFAALVTIGKLRFDALGPAVTRLTADGSPSVRAAALYAGRRLGQDVDLSPMANLLASDRPGERSNAALLLGMLGDRTAVPMIQEMSQTPMRRATAEEQAITHVQVAEALVKLGNEDALDAIRARAYSDMDEVRVLAVQTMGKVQDRPMMPAIRQIMNEPPPRRPPLELQLAAAEALARMGSPEGLEQALLAAASEVAPVRAQAAFTLGLINDPRAAAAVVRLLDDPVEHVRLAAAAAALRASGGAADYRS